MSQNVILLKTSWYKNEGRKCGFPQVAYRMICGKCHVSFVILKRNWCAVKLAAFPRGVTALIVRPRRSRQSWNCLPRHAGSADGCLFWRHLCCRAGVHCQFKSIKRKETNFGTVIFKLFYTVCRRERPIILKVACFRQFILNGI